jgi:hypothetical protein
MQHLNAAARIRPPSRYCTTPVLAAITVKAFGPDATSVQDSAGFEVTRHKRMSQGNYYDNYDIRAVRPLNTCTHKNTATKYDKMVSMMGDKI